MRFSRPEHKNYLVLMALCLAGYAWLYYAYVSATTGCFASVDACYIKQVSGIPCPSCGTTRAIITLLNGDLVGAVLINPLGILAAMFLLIIPIWIALDLLLQKSSLQRCYLKAESVVRRRAVAIPLILIVVLNWIWNITKGL